LCYNKKYGVHTSAAEKKNNQEIGPDQAAGEGQARAL